MAFFERASPALHQILLNLYSAKKPMEIDHHLYEFGSVEYHIQASAADPHSNYLSISTPLLCQGSLLQNRLSQNTLQMIKKVSCDAVSIVEPPKEDYQLTLKLNFAKIPPGKESLKVIRQIASVQAVILCSHLKEMLRNVDSEDASKEMYKPTKLLYHPREPFYIIKQPQKATVVFPMRFKEQTDVVIAGAFFQELMDIGSSEKWARVPPCIWSPIPPPELRGESLEDLSTNGGFVTFEISSCHVEGKRLDKTVWNLLNFYSYVKNHIKCTRGFIQRRMRKRLDNLVEVLHKESIEEDATFKNIKGRRHGRHMINLSKYKNLKHRCGNLAKKIKRIRSRIKVRGCGHFRRQWLTMPKFKSTFRYSRLTE